ncbi:MAG: HAD family hydrolase [Clostridia bacterium]|nr:HAD family hydrolase [Lachnospiraceae bacterium]NCB99197.1 HAD family hydrolase [Clostridia bacterium]NCD03369.1 HAD family hydrolase [Clostridia bacterium]
MIKACIFDLDGTLADTLESMSSTMNKVIEPFGYEPLPTDNFRYYAGDGAKTLVERALKDAGDKELQHLDTVYKAYSEVFDKDCTYKVRVFDGMRDTLQKLKAQGLKLAVLSNKPHPQTIKVISNLFGEGLFDHVQGQQEGIEKKPDPSGALAIAKAFGLATDECMYIGDTNVDMKTGNRAGMYTIGVLWGFRTKEELLENHAQALAEHPEDLLDLALYIAK